jgi:hypothetical protein
VFEQPLFVIFVILLESQDHDLKYSTQTKIFKLVSLDPHRASTKFTIKFTSPNYCIARALIHMKIHSSRHHCGLRRLNVLWVAEHALNFYFCQVAILTYSVATLAGHNLTIFELAVARTRP